MRVYWLEQSENDLPVDNDWLSANELELPSPFSVREKTHGLAPRSLDGEAGDCRLLELAKPSLASSPESRSAPLPPAPRRQWFQIWRLRSASHSAIVEALRSVPSRPLGSPWVVTWNSSSHRADAFVADYFTPQEQSLVARAVAAERPALVTLLWSAKESALKALHEGLRLDTRSVTVDTSLGAPDLSGWSPLRVRHVAGSTFYGWWRATGCRVHTIVASPMPASPICLGESEGPRLTELCVDLRMGMHATTEFFSMARQ